MYAVATGRQRQRSFGYEAARMFRHATVRVSSRAKWIASAIASAVQPTPASWSKKTRTA